MQVRCNILHSALLMKAWEVGFQDSESPLTTLILMWVPQLVWLRLGFESAVMCVFCKLFTTRNSLYGYNIAP